VECPGTGYCYRCGAWLELNTEKMCDDCYERWRVDYYAKPAAIMARCDIS